jgi:hypothetical protein
MSQLKLLVLPHPKDSSPIGFLSDSRDLYEMQSVQPRKYGSWFVNQRVLSQNGYLMGSKFNICYLCLPYLRKHGSRYSPIDQILAPMNSYDRFDFSDKHFQLLGEVCDVNNELGDDMVLCRYNEAKTLTWLKKRVELAANTLAKKRIIKAAFLDTTKHFNLSHQCSADTPASTAAEVVAAVGDEDRILAMQMIADYLEDYLVDKLLAEYKYEKSILQSKVTTIKRKADWEMEMEVSQASSCYRELHCILRVYLFIIRLKRRQSHTLINQSQQV